MPSGFSLSQFIDSGLVWFIVGVVLLLVELSAPGVLAIFFAAGAWLTAILLWIGVIHGPGLSIAVFLIASVLSLILLRRRLRAVVGSKVGTSANTDAVLDDFAGKIATVLETIDPIRQVGKVEFRGTHWDARSDKQIAAGARVIIVSRNNLLLTVKPIED